VTDMKMYVNKVGSVTETVRSLFQCNSDACPEKAEDKRKGNLSKIYVSAQVLKGDFQHTKF
jgi:hypothetical protein